MYRNNQLFYYNKYTHTHTHTVNWFFIHENINYISLSSIELLDLVIPD